MSCANLHKLHYQESPVPVPWCVEVRGTVTHDWRFDGDIWLHHENIEGLSVRVEFRMEKPLYVANRVKMLCRYHRKATRYFDYSKEDENTLLRWLYDNIGYGII